MDTLSGFPLLIIAEALFLALVAICVWLFLLRNRIAKAEEQNAALLEKTIALNEERDGLKEKLQQAAVQLKKQKELQTSKQEEALNNQLVSGYEKRIKNLEKFKALYFELEEKASNAESSNKQSSALQHTIDEQKKVILELKAELNETHEKYDLLSVEKDSLSVKLAELESNITTMQSHVSPAGPEDEDELARYRARAEELEANEQQLQQALEKCQRELDLLRQDNAGGAVQLKEIKDLNEQLQQRDDELRRTRQECETIALQYEELAMRSIELVGSGDELSEEQLAQLEELKQQVESNAAELARKKAECEMLENFYLELESSIKLEKAEQEVQQALTEKSALEKERGELGEQLESLCNEDQAVELAELRKQLSDKEAELADIRDDYRDIKDQFVAVAQEEIELRHKNDELEAECKQLKQELRELKSAGGLSEDYSGEMEKLREEYQKMEVRYLALLDKMQS